MSKYQLKNPTVEAIQWFPDTVCDLIRYRDHDRKTPYVVDKDYRLRYLHEGDWILFYDRKREISNVFSKEEFAELFEPVSKSTQPVEGDANSWRQENHTCLNPETVMPTQLAAYDKQTGKLFSAVSLTNQMESYFRQLFDIAYSKPFHRCFEVETKDAHYALKQMGYLGNLEDCHYFVGPYPCGDTLADAREKSKQAYEQERTSTVPYDPRYRGPGDDPRKRVSPEYNTDTTPTSTNTYGWLKWVAGGIAALVVLYILFYFLVGHAVIGTVTGSH